MARRALRGFPPVIDKAVRTLILGSFPSTRSLAQREYYGHPQNHFWKLVGHIIGVRLHEMRYDDRLKALLMHRIGLWDVIGRCERAGSLDAAIRNPTRNRISRVTRIATRLSRVCFNGKTAAQFEPMFAAQRYKTHVLPSSSPANTLPFRRKLRVWKGAISADGGNRQRKSGHRSRVTGH
jgi:hypoxanthine-DNA glycosylase